MSCIVAGSTPMPVEVVTNVIADITSAETRSGSVAANMAPIAPPSPQPTNAARSDRAASMTARTSSARCSSVTIPGTRSESPVPRLSKMITRPMAPSRSRK
jgi:hypothetical protein